MPPVCASVAIDVETATAVVNSDTDNITTAIAEKNKPDNNTEADADAGQGVTVGDATTTATESGVPLELQLHQVDLTDPRMDPIEWTVRKLVPIPKKYYWQEPRNDELPIKTKAWHATIRALQGIVRGGESAGETISNVTGLSSSEYSRDYYTPNWSPPDIGIDATRTASAQSQDSDDIYEYDNTNSASIQN